MGQLMEEGLDKGGSGMDVVLFQWCAQGIWGGEGRGGGKGERRGGG